MLTLFRQLSICLSAVATVCPRLPLPVAWLLSPLIAACITEKMLLVAAADCTCTVSPAPGLAGRLKLTAAPVPGSVNCTVPG